jgi:hypothetical protein
MSEEEVREITYTPLSEEFGFEEMFTQGAAALDLAAIFALERKDVEGLILIAREWTRMGSAISGIEIVPEEKNKLKFGFNKETVEEEEIGESTSKSDGEDDLQGKGRLRSYRVRSIRPRSHK